MASRRRWCSRTWGRGRDSGGREGGTCGGELDFLQAESRWKARSQRMLSELNRNDVTIHYLFQWALLNVIMVTVFIRWMLSYLLDSHRSENDNSSNMIENWEQFLLLFGCLNQLWSGSKKSRVVDCFVSIIIRFRKYITITVFNRYFFMKSSIKSICKEDTESQ